MRENARCAPICLARENPTRNIQGFGRALRVKTHRGARTNLTSSAVLVHAFSHFFEPF